jgi:serine/threonine-protein kinase
VTLSVSRGPQTTGVPEVTSLDRAAATQTLRSSGFRVSVVEETTEDPTLDNVVLSQDPEGGTELEPGSQVTITVGRFEALPADTDE